MPPATAVACRSSEADADVTGDAIGIDKGLGGGCFSRVCACRTASSKESA
jgi:hypothetical protein